MKSIQTLRRSCAGALLTFAAACFAAQRPASLLHRPAPEFVRTDLQNQPIDLHAYRGRVVLLTFWATWCAPCQVEMPRFVAWQQEYGPQGLQIIAISMDDDTQPVKNLLRRRHVNYPVIMGDVKLADSYGGVLGLPITYLIDRNGIVVARFKGESNLEAMRAQIETFLNSEPPH